MIRLDESAAKAGARSEKWIALLGRRDTPTDGVEDYCTFLGRALKPQGVDLRVERAPWNERGWLGALLQLWRESDAWRGSLVILQYTALGWSRRGFPLGAVAALWILQCRGARCAIVFHESDHQGQGLRWIDRIRGTCQDWVMRKLYQEAAKAIFTVPVETVGWLPKNENKAAFIPIGANIPEFAAHRLAPDDPNKAKTVIIFGVTGEPETAREVADTAHVMRMASKDLGRLRLVAVGRGAVEARARLAQALDNSDVDLSVRGILPPEEITHEFEGADVLLFIRSAITSQRGSAMAGIACGLPIVGYGDGKIRGPLHDAGVEWSRWGDREDIARGLVRVLSDPRRWMELHERNLAVLKDHLSWSRIAERYRMVLTQ